MKCLVRDRQGRVLVVREAGREWWDLPGGGIDHGETIKEAIAREMQEEVSLQGDFTYTLFSAEDPTLLAHGFYQLRLIVALTTHNTVFSPGVDADEIAFIDPAELKDSPHATERNVHKHSQWQYSGMHCQNIE
ncbi:MAG: NUDIX hydrolase [Candidatus Saccharimonadales bacterium]